MPENSPYIIEATAENFELEVLERSRQTPVIVDFWATWCQPCRTLGPLLESLAEEFAGKFVLVKAETEKVPEAATAFAVRSIPAVYAVRDGTVVNSFVGAIPEAAIRSWLKSILPSEAEKLLQEAKALEPTDLPAAEAKFRSAIDLEPKNNAAVIGLARVLSHQGRGPEALFLIEGLEAKGFNEPDAAGIKAEINLQKLSATTGGVEASRAALAADSSNPALRLHLVESLAATGGYQEALEIALELVENHRKAVGEDARKIMVNIFQMLPADSPLTSEYRRKLSAALY